MRVLSRVDDLAKGERCPNCRMIGLNLISIDNDTLACGKCGTLFLSTPALIRAYESKPSNFVCSCGREFKNQGGLNLHRRNCKAD